MRQQIVADWLSADPKLAGVLIQTHAQQRLQQDCLDLLSQSGVALGNRTRVPGITTDHLQPLQTSLRGNTLIFVHGSSAIVNKIKHLAPRLCAGLQEKGWQVNAIRVQVQPRLIKKETKSTKRGLTEENLRNWEAMATQLHDPGLQRAVFALLKHHQRKS
ncbi:hypothetical protein DU000_08900 [Parvibium lacunae]|uniref:DUF721 domain-containing protein n=2 Tax=Parvibium lacunae TaxID=1888893 RepID=A0A368L1W7_9BURK|nr:hypothetical protein DU000_08900 [Parvibium lacunae]